MSQHCHLFHHYHRHYHKRHRVHHYQCLAGQRLLLVDSCHDRLGRHLYRNQLRIRRHLRYHPDHYLAISHRLEREGGREEGREEGREIVIHICVCIVVARCVYLCRPYVSYYVQNVNVLMKYED